MNSDFHFWLGLGVSVAIGVLGLHMQHKNNELMLQSTAPAKRKAAANRPSVYQQYWPLLSMLVLTALAWAPYVFNSGAKGAPPEYMLGYGGQPRGAPISSPEASGFIETDGSYYTDDERSRFKLAAAVLFNHAGNDLYDEPLILKSGLYEIRPEQLTVVIPWNDAYRAAITQVHGYSDYALLLVPRSVGMNDFGTLHQAQSMGVRVVETRNGPP